MTINRLPAPTYRWLNMNAVKAESFSGGSAGVKESHTEGIIFHETAYDPGRIAANMGEEFDAIFSASGCSMGSYSIPADRKEGFIRRVYSLKDADALSPIRVEVKENAECTIILCINGQGVKEVEKALHFASQVRATIGDGAALKLVEVVMAPGYDVFCDIGVEAAKNSSFELVQLFLTAKRTYSGCRCELLGEAASMEADIAYHVASESLDMNYIANHWGRKTTSRMNAAGVLKSGAEKLFRGTIDFKRGAKGAIGNEQEDVLLLDEQVINRTIPLILCAEEDVEGNHGATIGKLAADLLFYLQSRGLSTEEIYEMMARARLEAVARRIGDTETEEAIWDCYSAL